jgi:hypothetical protein
MAQRERERRVMESGEEDEDVERKRSRVEHAWSCIGSRMGYICSSNHHITFTFIL